MRTAARRTYDHRLRELVCESGSLHLAARAGVPQSTAKTWMRRGTREVVTLDLAAKERTALQAEVVKLEERVAALLAMVRLLWMLVRLRGAQLDGERLPEGADKARVLQELQRATGVLPLDTALRLVGLSASRYHAWRRPERLCQLEDVKSCPKTTPTQVTAAEVRVIHEMATSEEYRHVPVSSLAILAQRLGRVYAAASTWSKLIRERGWRRPRQRVHPESPTEGVRATRPNEYWHIDVTVIRLLSGTRVHLQAVIDNFSRKILAWRVVPASEPRLTRELLLEASRFLAQGAPPPTVVADSGSENDNHEVYGLVSSNLIKLVLAQVDVVYSNSMIEAWWRSLKHQWLFLNKLDSLASVARLAGFYVHQHNTVIPHSALRGLTPDEVYFGTGAQVPAELAEGWRRAREVRLEANRAVSCRTCQSQSEVDDDSQIPFVPREIQLHPPESRMSS